MQTNLSAGATRNTSRRPYAAETTSARIGMSEDEIYAYAGDDFRNQTFRDYSSGVEYQDTARDFNKVLPHEA